MKYEEQYIKVKRATFSYDNYTILVYYKENIEMFNDTMYTCTVMIANISNIIEPFMPETTAKINNYFIKLKYTKKSKKISMVKLPLKFIQERQMALT